MGFGPTSPTPLYEDNTACIEWTDNVIGGRVRAKHIEIRKHFAHEAAQIGHLRRKRASTTESARRRVHQETSASTVGYDHRSSSPTDVALVIVRDVGPHEGGRDSQRRQSESTSTLTRGVSQ